MAKLKTEGTCVVDLRMKADIAPRCDCKQGTNGRWLFEHDGRLYGFDPPTQMQKNVWLSGNPEWTPGPRGEEARIAALRWACFGCGTVQMP